MKVLVDTSIWVSHFRQTNPTLTSLLIQDNVICHPFILGEIACGTPPSPRARTLSDLSFLTQSTIVTQKELLYLIEQNQLCGKGCGLIDIALLASTLLTPETSLWTLDIPLRHLSQQLNVEFES